MNDILDFPPSISKLLMLEYALGTWEHISTAVAMGRYLRDNSTVAERKVALEFTIEDFNHFFRPARILYISFSEISFSLFGAHNLNKTNHVSLGNNEHSLFYRKLWAIFC